MSSRWNRTIYVGNLPGDIRMREVEDLFYKYGPIVDIDLKIPPRPPGYAFVEFEDPRDADDAIYGRDGYDFDGCRLRVEIARSGRRGGSSSVNRYSSSYSGSRVPSRRSDYRVLVTGLPPSASWQDLKDHMRKAGDVVFSDVFRDRGGLSGVVDYSNYDDMKYAIRKLNDSEFRNAFSRAYIRNMSRGVWVAAHIIPEAGVGAVVEAIAIVAEAGVCHLLDLFPRVHGPFLVLVRHIALSQGPSQGQYQDQILQFHPRDLIENEKLVSGNRGLLLVKVHR
ncbi:unnamed protein product [Arabis nemorensis]|uniref:RRM domain-containing protein n=1 Tax=Arabis nemorensis TaxID=586526 RepID=A0A565APP0_9BRAS|nr:unnamed protein product [Arabis nemorensis]